MAAGRTRTTLALPADLLRRVDQAVKPGRARSRNAFVEAAMTRELLAAEEEAIDAAFALMAEDQEYLAEARSISEEFAISDWEAWRTAEPDLAP